MAGWARFPNPQGGTVPKRIKWLLVDVGIGVVVGAAVGLMAGSPLAGVIVGGGFTVVMALA